MMSMSAVDTSNNINLVDENYEDTYLYFWNDGTMKQIPYDEYIAKTGQKVKTFLNFTNNIRVIVVNVNNSQMILNVWNGMISDGVLVKSKVSMKFKASDSQIIEGNIIKHRISAEQPVLLFSLNKENFGKEIKPKVIDEEF